MTYFGFLLLFVGLPGVVLFVVHVLDRRRGRDLPHCLQAWPAWILIGLHAVIAVIYTTPWDNYLVATQVWWYDEALVSGIVLGWVPLEEYLFFVVQPLFTGLLWLALARRLAPPAGPHRTSAALRWCCTSCVLMIGLLAAVVLWIGWKPGTYAALELSWAALPLAIQLGFGADILWRRRVLVGCTIAVSSVYLSIADALAIHSGTWTISPEQSTGWLLAGTLPVEEFVFFTLTSTLVVFGVTLGMAQESQYRLPAAWRATTLERSSEGPPDRSRDPEGWR